MNWLDIRIIIACIGFAAVGFMQGFLKTTVGFFGLLIGIVIAGQYYDPFAETLLPTDKGWALVVAFVGIIVMTLGIASLLGTMVIRCSPGSVFGWEGKFGSIILGSLFGALLCAAILSIVAAELFDTSFVGNTIRESCIAASLIDQSPVMLSLLPEEFGFLDDFFNG